MSMNLLSIKMKLHHALLLVMLCDPFSNVFTFQSITNVLNQKRQRLFLNVFIPLIIMHGYSCIKDCSGVFLIFVEFVFFFDSKKLGTAIIYN